MSPRRSHKSPTDSAARRWEGLLLGLVTALWVARPIVPSDLAMDEGHGMLLVMFWLAAAAAVVALALKEGRPLRFAGIDAAIALLAGIYVLSALAAVYHGSPRLAITRLWEWLGLTAAYFVTRQTIVTPLCRRGLVAAMLALCAGMAGTGIYQLLVEMPRDRELYEQIKDDPAAMLKHVGLWYPPGSPDRIRFENRLQSSEVSATFTLANSLAALLAPWLIVGLGFFFPSRSSRRRRSALLRMAILLIPIAVCLVLTKSRSAYVAVVVAAIVMWLVRGWRTARLARHVAVLAVACGLLAVAAVGASLLLDRQVLTEAGKSLAVRLQYWRASVWLILDHPWLGCGPGQFRFHYTRYQAADASEQVTDPHHFLFETWATAGSFAAALLLIVLGTFAWRSWRQMADRPPARPPGDDPLSSTAMALGSMAGVVVGGCAGIAAHLPLAPAHFLILLIGTIAGWALLAPWVAEGELPRDLPAWGVLALLIALSASGGISFPGVAGTLWLLMALATSADQGERGKVCVQSHAGTIAVAALCLTALVCHVTAWRPFSVSSGKVEAALQLEDPRNAARREQLLKQAVAADPWSLRAADELLRLQVSLFSADPVQGRHAEVQQAIEQAVRVAPLSSGAWSRASDAWSQVYRKTRNRADLAAALEAAQRAVELYPRHALLRARWAELMNLAGRDQGARRQAEAALQLDDVARAARHADRVLSDEQRRKLLRITRGAD